MLAADRSHSTAHISLPPPHPTLNIYSETTQTTPYQASISLLQALASVLRQQC